MTPERIAQLRGVARVHEHAETRNDYSEMLDEIDRLRGLVAQAHQMRFSEDQEVWCSGCFWNHDSMSCGVHMARGEEAQPDCESCTFWPMAVDGGTDAEAMHAEHVRSLLDGPR